MSKKLAILSSVVLAATVLAVGSVSAATISVGNDTSARTGLDTAQNFTIIDKNNPATADGNLTQFKYYASNTSPFRFVLVDGSSVVRWVSSQITPQTTGVNTYVPSSPIQVQAGWNVGLYFVSQGTIPFELSGQPAYYTSANSGVPSVNSTLNFAGNGARKYSFVATGETPSTQKPAKFYVGNSATQRTQVDNYSNFTIIDSNNPATDSGKLTKFKYYAANTNSFRFLVVDTDNIVKWISPKITPRSTGANTYIPATPVKVKKDWRVGMYFASTGTIPFEQTGQPAYYTNNNNGKPSVGSKLNFAGNSNRIYSFVATGEKDRNGRNNGNSCDRNRNENRNGYGYGNGNCDRNENRNGYGNGNGHGNENCGNSNNVPKWRFNYFPFWNWNAMHQQQQNQNCDQ